MGFFFFGLFRSFPSPLPMYGGFAGLLVTKWKVDGIAEFKPNDLIFWRIFVDISSRSSARNYEAQKMRTDRGFSSNLILSR